MGELRTGPVASFSDALGIIWSRTWAVWHGKPEDSREPVTRIERVIVNPPSPVDERTCL